MRHVKRISGVKRFAALTALLLMTGCAVASGDACPWVERIILDGNWEERLTRDEKVQIAGHNENVLDFCR